MMSHNDQLLDTRIAGDDTSIPRCTAKIAHLYRRKEGDPQEVQRTSDNDRERAVRAVVRRLFGTRTPKTPSALGCEIYLRAAIARWLQATCRSEDSWTCYATRLWLWTGWSGRRALSGQTDTGPRSVADWLYHLEQQDRSARTIVAYRETLGSWFRWLSDRELMTRSPVNRDIRRLHRVDRGTICKASGRRQVLTMGEANRAAGWAMVTATPEAGLSVILQLTGGLRSAEVAALERRHLVEREGVWALTVPGKGKRTRSVTLEPIAVQLWKRYVHERRRQGERGPLLVAPGGGHYCRRSVQRWAKEAAECVGRPIEISSHDLRKTFATQLLLRGADLEQVQRLLGHASADTTLTCYVTDLRPMTVTTGIQLPEDSHEPA